MDESKAAISPDLLEILRCPLGKSELDLKGETLVCRRCGPTFSIQDGIPVMLIEEAQLPAACPTVDDLPCIRDGTAEKL